MPEAEQPNPFDEVPYLSLSFADSHPGRLAAIAMLAGLAPPPLDNCRVLELGCASGGNLLPMALGLPNAEFVGVDYSARQVEEGRDTIRAAGLANVRLEHLNILDVDASFGQFDYIISHGVYSWVPQPVRERLLAVCKENLAPNGVAYVSYNTYPGWHMLGAIREMMLYHTRDIASPQERAAEARRLVTFLADALPPEKHTPDSFLHPYAVLLQSTLGNVGKRDSLLLHDELAEFNEPVYFHDFAAHAQRHGLQYLADTPFSTALPSSLPRPVADTLREMARDAVDMQQYMDFVRNRTFRQSLLCHEGVPIRRDLQADPAMLAAFSIVTHVRPQEPGFDFMAKTVTRFQAAEGAALSTDHPVSKAAIQRLAQISPRGLSFDELLAGARQEVYGDDAPGGETLATDVRVLATNLVAGYCYSQQLVEFSTHRAQFVCDVSERPRASPLARCQAGRGLEIVANMRHERVELDPLGRCLLPCLDGEHDHAALLAIAEELAGQGIIAIEEEGRPIAAGAERRSVLGEELETSLRWLARAALLIA